MAAKISENQATQLKELLRTTMHRIKDGTLRIGGMDYSPRTFKQVEDWYIEHNIDSKDPAKKARWDLFYAIPQPLRDRWLNSIGYNDSKKGVKDSHIDTVLKEVLKNL